MKTTAELKKFFKEKFGVTVRVNTNSGNAHWQRVHIPYKFKDGNLNMWE